jgi:hypothetical protein
MLLSGAEYEEGLMKVTLGGDQLTRCHMDSAKHLRSGSHTTLQRFENLAPVVEEFFHVLQDLLEVSLPTLEQSQPAKGSSVLVQQE